ncbi:G2/M phase-specific E3 ubiquitin-protein ligase-like [Pagrus major]|uniref:G2/M phase-specific E3 ubiquitin-protein ligase-like n=1 Tax=Pagrus major TaxID=143350 RepID=UPI003CC89886
MLHKSTGGGGRRSLVVIPPDLHGYTGQQLKAVSGNGKYTLYISPLQEELDTIPLPPEAKEFENMPKAQCTTCKKMIPLQILPVHIKECRTEFVDLSSSAEEESCNEAHEDESPDSICDQTGKTAECPVCNNAFQVDMIEIHAATCGLRPSKNDGHESSGSVPVSQISTFQSAEEILDWVALQVVESDTFSICVSRTDLFSRGMQQWQRQKKTSPKCRLKVRFFGEAGIDTGALSREFLTEMLAEIENRLFVGGSDKKGKNPVYCLNSLDSNYFRSAGEVMAASLAQGGPCPKFMREWCFRYLCSGDSDSILVSPSDVTDLELSQLIERINSASKDNINDLIDDIVTCGYTGPVSMEKRDSMIRTVILHSTMRVLPMLDQLRKGLQVYDLPKVMKSHEDLCQTLFIPGEDDEADAAFVLESSCPVYSETGSAKHQKEVNIMNFLQDYLQEIEDSGHEGPSNKSICPEGLTVGRIMQWVTGQRHKPVLPSEKKDFGINIKFKHDCDTKHTLCFPTVSACSRTVTFPSAHLGTYSEFKNIMTQAICHGQTFDKV